MEQIYLIEKSTLTNLDKAIKTVTNTSLDTKIQMKNLSTHLIEESNKISFMFKCGLEDSPHEIQLKAIKGMTWQEWFTSSYNIMHPALSHPAGQIMVQSNSVSYTNFVMSPSVSLHGAGVHPTDPILDGAVYTALYTICCFVEGTQILTSLTGETTPIEQLQIGDEVISYNFGTKENYITTVKNCIIHPNTINMAEVILEDGSKVVMHDYHPIYTKEGWKSLTNYLGLPTLQYKDVVKTYNGWSKIISLKHYLGNPINTFNIDVVDREEMDYDNNERDNYYANGILAHNPFCGF